MSCRRALFVLKTNYIRIFSEPVRSCKILLQKDRHQQDIAKMGRARVFPLLGVVGFVNSPIVGFIHVNIYTFFCTNGIFKAVGNGFWAQRRE